jgi:hypothetical protein
MRSQITCITWDRSDPERSHEAIRRVGGVRADGERFNISRHQCAEGILSGIESYCVLVHGVLLDVTAYEKNGQKFIKTKPTKDRTDSLLSLDPC